MFEFSTAWRYLTSSRSRRSSGTLVFAAVATLSLVIWLAITFLTVSQGIESRWTNQISRMTGDLRITPTVEWLNAIQEEVPSFSPDYDSFTSLLEHPSSSSPALDSFQKLFTHLKTESQTGRYQAAPFLGTIVELQLTFGQIADPYAPRHTIEHFCYLTTLPEEHPYYRPLSNQPIPELLIPAYLGEKFNLETYSVQSSSLFYHATTPFGSKKQKMGMALAGTYDAGILPLPLLLGSPSLVQYIRTNQGPGQREWNFGWQLWLNNACDARAHSEILPSHLLDLQRELIHFLKESGSENYWVIENYGQISFTRDLINELLNQRSLFSLLGILVTAVAATNITMLLHLLVHDRAQEISILYALGTSRWQIVSIFSLAGVAIGACSVFLGSCGAVITLFHLDFLITLISRFQGRPFLPSQFYGSDFTTSPNTSLLISTALITIILAFLSALLPAWRATRLQPSELLKE